MHPEKIGEAEERMYVFPVTEGTNRSIYLKCKQDLIGKQMNLKTCAVCDVLENEEDFYCKTLKQFFQ